MDLLSLWFRHRSSILLLLGWPILWWTLHPRVASAAELAGGALLIAAGVSLRLASIRHIGRGARVHSAKARGGLATAGPYRFVRNPLYVAAGLMLIGLGLLAGGSGWAFAHYPATLLAYTPVVLHEERCIRGQLGAAFDAYTRAVPRWFPARDRPPRTARDAGVSWHEVLRREPFLVPGLWSGAGVLLLVQLGLLPWRSLVEVLETALHGRATLVFGLLLVSAAVSNSVGIEWKRRRRRHRARSRAVSSNIAHTAAPPKTAPRPDSRAIPVER